MIYRQIQQILDDKSDPQPGEEKLAALTSGDRSQWAQARRNLFNKGTNKVSLDTIEKATFIVTLDDCPYIYDPVSIASCSSLLMMYYFIFCRKIQVN